MREKNAIAPLSLHFLKFLSIGHSGAVGLCRRKKALFGACKRWLLTHMLDVVMNACR
jgi:hypothetical protein